MSNWFDDLKADDVQRLAKTPELDESYHKWSAGEIDSLSLALAARRPLLVRGEPGCGKTQLARAAAAFLRWDLHSIVVTGRTEPQDLLYTVDAMGRLADAQIGTSKKAASIKNYCSPGPLWLALGWETANPLVSRANAASSGKAAARGVPNGHVVLIDEIDKADSELPNSLLEVLGQRSHHIAPLNIHIGGPDRPQPLIVVTTNEDRALPAPFLRRCMVLNIRPADAAKYEDWLVERGQAHFSALDSVGRPERIKLSVLRMAAKQLCADRHEADNLGLQAPGAAEYLDLLYALHEWPLESLSAAGIDDEVESLRLYQARRPG